PRRGPDVPGRQGRPTPRPAPGPSAPLRPPRQRPDRVLTAAVSGSAPSQRRARPPVGPLRPRGAVRVIRDGHVRRLGPTTWYNAARPARPCPRVRRVDVGPPPERRRSASRGLGAGAALVRADIGSRVRGRGGTVL